MVLEELGVVHGSARVDLAVINGIMHGYEIKSDLDTLKRLGDQIELYNQVFDKMTIVVGATHFLEASKMIPAWWGIITARSTNNGVKLNGVRSAIKNPSKDSLSIAKLLWRDEALALLEKIDEARGYKYKPRKQIYEKLAVSMDQSVLCYEVRETLFNRANWRVA